MSYTDNLIWSFTSETQDEAAAADLLDVEFPAGGVIYDFVVTQTETGSGAVPVVALDVSSSVTESDRTEKATITPSTTQAAGSRVKADASKFPIVVPPGGRATIRHKSAGAAAGAYIAGLAYRHNGLATRGTTASPLTEVTA